VQSERFHRELRHAWRRWHLRLCWPRGHRRGAGPQDG
jgi:hypothetical protein